MIFNICLRIFHIYKLMNFGFSIWFSVVTQKKKSFDSVLVFVFLIMNPNGFINNSWVDFGLTIQFSLVQFLFCCFSVHIYVSVQYKIKLINLFHFICFLIFVYGYFLFKCWETIGRHHIDISHIFVLDFQCFHKTFGLLSN